MHGVEKQVLAALSRADIGYLPRNAQLHAAENVFTRLVREGLIASYELKIAESPSSPRTLTIAWSATLPSPARSLSVPVGELTRDHWEIASVMDS